MSGTREAPEVEAQRSRRSSSGPQPELVVASGDLTHRGRPGATRGGGGVPALSRPARARGPREPRHPVHVPGALHAHVRRVRAPLGDHRARLQLADAVRRRAQLGARLAAPVGRNPGDAARAAARAPRRGAGGRAAGRRAAPPSDRRALALAQEAGRPPLARPGGARRLRRRADPRGPHPPGRRQRAARVRGHPRATCAASIVSIAPGLGQPRPKRRGEARGLHVYECDPGRSSSRPTSGARTTGAYRGAPFRARPRAPGRRGVRDS